MSDLEKWYRVFNKQDEQETTPPVVVNPVTTSDSLQIKDPKEEFWKRVAEALQKREQNGNNTDNFTEKKVEVKLPDGENQEMVIQKQEIKQDNPVVINPTSDAETVMKNDRLERDTVDPKPKEYVEKRDDVLVEKLIAINTSAGHLIQRLSFYSNYLTQPLEHLERKKILEQLMKLQTTYGSILAELNMV